MIVNYNRLWKVLIDKKMNKKDLRLAANISTTAVAKLTEAKINPKNRGDHSE